MVVLDVANVMGSRPDGWWRDRAAAASRMLTGAAGVCALGGRGSEGVVTVVAVLEGAAATARDPEVPGLEVVRAPGSGDDTVVEVANACDAALTRGGGAGRVVVVTADRGLRARLPDGVEAVGPRWWWGVLESVDATAG